MSMFFYYLTSDVSVLVYNRLVIQSGFNVTNAFDAINFIIQLPFQCIFCVYKAINSVKINSNNSCQSLKGESIAVSYWIYHYYRINSNENLLKHDFTKKFPLPDPSPNSKSYSSLGTSIFRMHPGQMTPVLVMDLLLNIWWFSKSSSFRTITFYNSSFHCISPTHVEEGMLNLLLFTIHSTHLAPPLITLLLMWITPLMCDADDVETECPLSQQQ